MTRSSTSELYRAARASNNLRAIRRGFASPLVALGGAAALLVVWRIER